MADELRGSQLGTVIKETCAVSLSDEVLSVGDSVIFGQPDCPLPVTGKLPFGGAMRSPPEQVQIETVLF